MKPTIQLEDKAVKEIAEHYKADNVTLLYIGQTPADYTDSGYYIFKAFKANKQIYKGYVSVYHSGKVHFFGRKINAKGRM